MEGSGAGSIWNVGSWFWEEKNYNKWAHEVLPPKIQELQIDDISITEVTKFKGEASINIRKGKTIFLFEFEIEGKWACSDIDGTFKVLEFDQNDIDDL
jgi:activator of HSP90 ATPase